MTPGGAGPHVPRMQKSGPWIAFLLMCFLVTGLVGLFASYATPIPFQRALLRSQALDQVLLDPSRLDALGPALGDAVERLRTGPGDIASRVAAERGRALAEAEAEGSSVGRRARLMLGTVTVLAGGLGAGIMLLAARAHRG